MDKNAELLFDYLGDVLYNPANASLNIDDLDEDFKELGKGLIFVGESVVQLGTFARHLAQGNLDATVPPPQNELAAPLKSLHASLKHITWQTQQVAKGDYQQQIDFMGEFSEAFNTMISQLDQRQRALMSEIESGKRKTRELEQSNLLFENVAAFIPQWIVVLDHKTGRRLYQNPVAEMEFSADSVFADTLNAWMKAQAKMVKADAATTREELSLPYSKVTRHLSIELYPLRWRNRNAVVFVITDISREKSEIRQLENVAYRDALTQVYSRHYGMRLLDQMISEQRDFIICFVDLDGLKFVNDRYGHLEGDKYIIAVTEQLREFPDAILCRLGGDELMLLAEGWSYEATVSQMENIREALAALPQDSDKPYLRSISYGVVEVDDRIDLPTSELLSIADARMYEYKRAHKKNRK